MVLLLQLLAMKKREKEEELRALRLSVAAEKKKSEDNLEWSKMQAEKDRMSHSIVGREWMMDNRRQKALQKQEEEYTLRSAAATPTRTCREWPRICRCLTPDSFARPFSGSGQTRACVRTASSILILHLAQTLRTSHEMPLNRCAQGAAAGSGQAGPARSRGQGEAAAREAAGPALASAAAAGESTREEGGGGAGWSAADGGGCGRGTS